MNFIPTPAEKALQAMLTLLRAIAPSVKTKEGWIQDGLEYYIDKKSVHEDGSIEGYVSCSDPYKKIGSFEIAADGRIKWFPCSGPEEWAAATETAQTEQFTVRATLRLLKFILPTQYPKVYVQKSKGQIEGVKVTRFGTRPEPDKGKGIGVWARGLFVTDDEKLADFIRNLAAKD